MRRDDRGRGGHAGGFQDVVPVEDVGEVGRPRGRVPALGGDEVVVAAGRAAGTARVRVRAGGRRVPSREAAAVPTADRGWGGGAGGGGGGARAPRGRRAGSRRDARGEVGAAHERGSDAGSPRPRARGSARRERRKPRPRGRRDDQHTSRTTRERAGTLQRAAAHTSFEFVASSAASRGRLRFVASTRPSFRRPASTAHPTPGSRLGRRGLPRASPRDGGRRARRIPGGAG